ncbi:metal-dependent hydrolase [bacterium]|nr:metal-dependent hydrolase [bacterium]
MVSNVIVSPEETLIPAIGAILCSNLPDLDFFTKMLPENTIFMKLHHGISHSIFTGLVLVTLVSTSLFFITGFHSFPLLFLVCFLALCSHLALDAFIHNTGIQLFAPLSNKFVSMPILLGLNPLSTSAKCYKKSLFVCLNCQFNTAIKSPTVIILFSGFMISLIFYPYIGIISLATLSICFTYHLFLYTRRRLASDFFLNLLEKNNIVKFGVYSAMFSPYIWQGVASQKDGSVSVIRIDIKNKKILSRKKYDYQDENTFVKKSKELKVVKDFIRKSVFPFVFTHSNNGENIIKWKDLGYDFSDTIDLYTLIVKYDSSMNLLEQKFLERW